MGTHNLPYALADHRSYIAAHSSRPQPDQLYPQGQQDVQYRTAASYKYFDHRYPPTHARAPGGIAVAAQGRGIQDAQTEYELDLQAGVGGAYAVDHAGGPSQSQFSPANSAQPYIPAVEQSHYNAPPYRNSPQTERFPAPSPSASSNSPPSLPDPLPSTSRAPDPVAAPVPQKEQVSSPSSTRRKDKPRLALAPDQPLTSQGKPRTRVYVACVQCRSRKIRCDGAKPICHNCSRRTGPSSSSPPECTYDTAPKRRGPDRVPGARQRVTGQESTDGGKVRKRRRRPPEPPTTEQGHEDNVNAQAKGDGAESSNQKALQMEQVATIGTAAQSQVPARPTGLTVVVDDLDAYGEQNRTTAYTLGSSSGSGSIISPLPYMPVSHEIVAPPPEIPALNPLQDIAQFTNSPVYYKPPISTLTYVGYAPPATLVRQPDGYGYEYEYEDSGEQKTQIGAEPSMQFTRDTWWDALLLLYSGRTHGLSPEGTVVLTRDQRESTTQQVILDLRQLFRASNYWFSFLNVSRFFVRLHDPRQRQMIQPSLVLAALAVSVFIHSSEREGGSKGRAWAMRLRDEAQGALEASLSTRSVDLSLVHAAWLIAFFEICAHPNHATGRVHSTFGMLDSLIRTLSLTQVDIGESRVSAFASQIVPSIPTSPQSHSLHQWSPSTSQLPAEPNPGPCTCASYTLGHVNPVAQQVTPLWLTTPAWDPNWSEAEISKEECRRIVWSSMMLSAGHSSYASAKGGFSDMDLYINDPSNYAVFFPGETIISPRMAPKDSIWALYMRAMLLWHSCIRMRRMTNISDGDKARFAVNGWLEVDKIEEGLNRHTCNIERAYLFQGREYLFNCRMSISHEFSRYIPQATANANLLFHRKQAEEWLKHQAWVAKQVVNGLQTVTHQPNVSIGKRPFFVFWFMSQIQRALTLWARDQSLIVALDVSKALMGPIEFLMALWPCPEQRKRYHDLIDVLANACATVGIPPPQIYSPVAVTRPIPR